MDYDKEIEEILNVLNLNIALELLKEVNSNADYELATKMLKISSNPWDAAILYTLIEMKK